jgi:O-antigen/teichoic acid export membrane protein
VTGAAADADLGRRVVHGSVLRLAAFGVANVLAALGAVLVLRYLGVERFGRYGTVLALLTIVQGISDAGLSVTAVRELALLEDGDDRRRLLAHVLGARVVLTGLGVLAAVAFAAVAGYRTELVIGTAVGGVGILLASVQAAMVLPLAVELRNGAIAINEVVRQTVLVSGFAVLVVVEAPLVAFFAVQIAVGAALLAVAPVLVGRHWLVRPRWTAGELRALARTALPSRSPPSPPCSTRGCWCSSSRC